MITTILMIILYFVIGLIVGFLSAILGIGGGVVLVPLYSFIFQLQGNDPNYVHSLAIGSSLLTVVFASTSATIRHFKNDNVEIKFGIIFGVFTIISSFLLSQLAINTDQKTLKLIFIIVLAIIITIMLLDKKAENNLNKSFNKKLYLLIPVVGFVIGALSAFTGVGGGIIAVPIFYYIFKINFKKAIGTSTLVIIFSTITASLSYLTANVPLKNPPELTIGLISLFVAIPTGIGTLFSTKWGANVVKNTQPKKLKIYFSFLLLFVIIKMLFDILK